MSIDRTSFLQQCELSCSSQVLLEKAKKRNQNQTLDDSRCYCTGFTNVSESYFPSLVKYWLSSLILTHIKPPKVRIIYTGEYPTFLEGFNNVEITPQLWHLDVENKGVASFNFATKIQSVWGSSARLSAWVDADVLFEKDTFEWTSETSFIGKRKRVAGGFYCLEEKDKWKFYLEYLRTMEKTIKEQGHLNSDQKIMRRILEQTGIRWKEIGEVYNKAVIHFSRSVSKQEAGRKKYKTILENLMNSN